MHKTSSALLALGWHCHHFSGLSGVPPPGLFLLVSLSLALKALPLGLCPPLGLLNTQKAENSSREVVGGGNLAGLLYNEISLRPGLSLVPNLAHLASLLINTKPFLQLHMPCSKASNHTYHINMGFRSPWAGWEECQLSPVCRGQ